MNCRTIRRKDIIEDYLAHRLGEALADEFETHLLGCSRCSRLLEYMQSLRDGLEERASSIRTAKSKEIAKSEDRQLIQDSASFKRLSASSALIMTLKEAEQSLAAEKKTIEAQAGEIKKQLEAGSAERESDLLRGWDAIASYLHCEVRFLLRWATIAGFLGRGVRTVQLWERSLGFPPVRRDPSGPGSVYAYKSEIDAWLTQQGFDPKKNKLDAWLKRRGEILGRGTDRRVVQRIVDRLSEGRRGFPQEQATTEEKTKKPSEQ